MKTTALLPKTTQSRLDEIRTRVATSRQARLTRRDFWKSREDWLKAAVEIFRPRFAAAGFPLPEALNVSVSWAYVRGGLDASKVWGQCFPPEVSRDKKTTQIAIAPWADAGERETPLVNKSKKAMKVVKISMVHEVLNTLLHECIHAAVGTKEGHAGQFKSCALKMGYGPDDMITTPLSEELYGWFDALLLRLGYYPHTAIQVQSLKEGILTGAITIADGPKAPKPSNIKNKYAKVICETEGCSAHGYTARVYTGTIEKHGTPICPGCQKPMTDRGTHAKGSKATKDGLVAAILGALGDQIADPAKGQTVTITENKDAETAPF